MWAKVSDGGIGNEGASADVWNGDKRVSGLWGGGREGEG